MGNVDKHRRTYSNGVKAVEESKWGAATARERYGAATASIPKPPHDCYPQFRQDQRLNNKYDHANDWVRGAGESAEGKPSFRNSQGYNGKK